MKFMYSIVRFRLHKQSEAIGNFGRQVTLPVCFRKLCLGRQDGSVGKMLGAKPDGLSLILRIYVVEGENKLLQLCSDVYT